MKLVTAVIHPETFEDVKAALENLPAGRPVFTECSSRHPPRRAVYRGVAYTIDLGPMIRVEVVCDLFDARTSPGSSPLPEPMVGSTESSGSARPT